MDKIRQTLLTYFPAISGNDPKQNLLEIYKRMKTILGSILYDEYLEELRVYLLEHKYKQDVIPFWQFYRKLFNDDDERIRQINYHPERYQDVYEYMYNILYVIEDALGIVETQYLYDFDVDLIPKHNVPRNVDYQYLYPDPMRIVVHPQQKQKPLKKHKKQQSINKILSSAKYQQQSKQKTTSSQIISAIPTTDVQDQYKNIRGFIYNHKLLDLISSRCLKDNEKIRIIDAYQKKDRYVDKWTSSSSKNFDYFMVLYVDDNPVSQIRYEFLEQNYRELIISSDTKEQFRQRHYNTILRIATVLLAPTMMMADGYINEISSQAQNPLSVYTLLKLGFDYNRSYVVHDFDPQYTPSQIQNQTKQQQQQRKTQQKQLLQYLLQLSNEYDEFEIPMVLRRPHFEKSSKLAMIALNRICKQKQI